MKSDPQSETCDERQELYLTIPCHCFLIWKKVHYHFRISSNLHKLKTG